jgi:hypothetical protein
VASGDCSGARSALLAALVCVSAAATACGEGQPQPRAAGKGDANVSCALPQPPEWVPMPVGAAAFVVNRGTRGMMAAIHWTMPADSSALLVIEDPTGVENEAIPDGVMFASERTGRTWRMDSVWSVAPSPDWRELAVGRGAVLRNGEADSIPAAQWDAVSRALSAIAGPNAKLSADSLRAYAFPASGMTYAMGVAATFEVDVDGDVDQFPVRYVVPGGWSVAWLCQGGHTRTLTAGSAPSTVQDNDPAPGGSVKWTRGPTLEMGARLARDSVVRMRAREREIEGRAGTIRVRDGSGAWRTVGPGIPLASTRGGRFILAVAPRTGAREHESPDHAVVYRVP